MKHTPGPWEVIEKDLSIRTKDFDVPQCGQGDYRGQIIASVDPTKWARECRKDVIPTMKANAHLIAAAPELLEACKSALYNIDWLFPKEDEVWKALKQAIAKVEGK